MFQKNLRYLRLKANMTKKELAQKAQLSAMAISHYESGNRKPTVDIINRLAKALNARPMDFLRARNDKLSFVHGDFRKRSALNLGNQEYMREEAEAYFNRFYNIVDILGDHVLADPPDMNCLVLDADDEINAKRLREHLGFPSEGPIGALIGALENNGILVHQFAANNEKFDGMHGTVEERPFIIVNSNMNTERQRSTLVHELAHMFFVWPDDMEQAVVEKKATAIAGAFLFPKQDVLRELGIRRSQITKDMVMVAIEYGVSLQLLAVRAKICGVISDDVHVAFRKRISALGWAKHEPSRIPDEKPTLMTQLVYRAVNEQEISIQKGAELLQTSYEDVAKNCSFSLANASNLQ